MRAAVGVALYSERRVFELIVAVADNSRAEFVVDDFRLVSAADAERFGRGGPCDVDVGFTQTRNFIAYETADRVNRARGHAVQFA